MDSAAAVVVAAAISRRKMMVMVEVLFHDWDLPKKLVGGWCIQVGGCLFCVEGPFRVVFCTSDLLFDV